MADAKVVFLHGLPPEVVVAITSYTPQGFATTVVDGQTDEDDQVRAVRDADFLIVHRASLSDRVLRAGARLRMVQLLAAGYDSMNLGLMGELEIPCANNGGANSWAVADHAVLLMLALYRRLILADGATRQGRWDEPVDGLNTFEMADKLVGIVGMGNIGRQVARRVKAFDARVQYYDKYPATAEVEGELCLTLVGLDDLFSTSDIITCHTPLTSETRHLASRERIALMKPTAVLINTSRGPVVDEVALTDALREGRIAGAGLDVFEQEPVDPGNPLLEMDNVAVTPHMAGLTWNTWFRRAEFAYGNVKRVWDGEAPLAVARDFEA